MVERGMIIRKLLCNIFHRRWHYYPVEGWQSSRAEECRVCGRLYAVGRYLMMKY